MLRKLAVTAILAVAGLAVASPAAAATCQDVTQTSSGNVGLLNGTNIAVPFNLGLDVTGNALGLLGLANANGNHTVTC